MDLKRCFEILELDPHASPEEAKQAYKDIVNVWHPDRFSNNIRLKEKAEKKIKEVNAAYDTVQSFLSSKETREPAEKKDSGEGSTTEARDNTEALVEAGTSILLNACSYFYRTIRRFVADQAQKLEEKADSEPVGRDVRERQDRAGGTHRGKGMGRAGGGMGRGGGVGRRRGGGMGRRRTGM